ncbi:hypothetical protein HWV62_29967 [Athelia sp. TMB]|nr:hypothetical protein HWV62_29967 [Athelia sp. TMB]
MAWTKASLQAVLEDMFLNKDLQDLPAFISQHFSPDYKETGTINGKVKRFDEFVQHVIQLRRTIVSGTVTVYQCSQNGCKVAVGYTVDAVTQDGSPMRLDRIMIGKSEEDGHRFLKLWEAPMPSILAWRRKNVSR